MPRSEREPPQRGSPTRRRIEEALGALERGGEPDPDRRRAILEARARRLAEPARETVVANAADVLRFRVGEAEYAVEPGWLAAVFPSPSLARLPRPDPAAVALTSWRGQILRVVDLPRALGLSPQGLDEHPIALVFGADRPRFVVLARDRPEPFRLDRGSLSPPPAEADAELLEGMTPDAVVLLDGAALVNRLG